MTTFNEIACLPRFPKEVVQQIPSLPLAALEAVEEVRRRWPKFHPGAELILLGGSDDGQVLIGISLGDMRIGNSVSTLWSAVGTGRTWPEALKDLDRSVRDRQREDRIRRKQMEEDRRRSRKAHDDAYRRLQEIPAGSEEARRLNLWLRMESVRCRTVQ